MPSFLRMAKLDNLAIFVRDVRRSREWYVGNLGLTVEFEIPHMNAVALQDEGGFTIFLGQPGGEPVTPSCVLTFQVADVEAKYRELSTKGVEFKHAPQKLAWGYGAELLDPDGYVVCLWDEKSMREKGGA
jgi:catechol 2,3-dioxygenase-like lactoylglutathione lyase family enzyme